MTRRVEWAAASALVVGVLVFLFLPAAVVVIFAFEPTERISLPMTGLSLKWFEVVLTNPQFQGALGNSLVAATASAVTATILGTMAAFGLQHLSPRWRQGGLILFLLPAIVPGLLLGVGLIILFHILGIGAGMATIVIGHTVVAIPFVVFTVAAQVERLDPSHVEAARDLGASGVRAWLDVTWPLVRTAIVAVGLLSAALSLDEFIVTFFINGGTMTGPLLIWGKMRLGIDPSINALATLVLVGTLVLSLISSRITRVRL
jgi:spermidine/putrescine transport system permease protein